MKRSKSFFSKIGLTSLAMSIAFVGNSVWASDAPEKIRIGVNAPLTGMHSGFGEGNVYGEKAAVADINAQGGLYIKEFDQKIPIELIIVDNESDPKKSASLTENLILKDKVHFLAPPNQPIPLVIPQAITAERYKVVRVSGGTPEEPWLAVRNESQPKWDHTWTYTLAIAAPAEGRRASGESRIYLYGFLDRHFGKIQGADQ